MLQSPGLAASCTPPPPPPPARPPACRACARPSLRAACVQYSVGEPVHVYFAPHAPPQSLAANGPLASGTQRDTGEPAQTKALALVGVWPQLALHSLEVSLPLA